MRHSRAQQLYDVKTFLNRNKSSGRIMCFSFSDSVRIILLKILPAIIPVLVVAWIITKLPLKVSDNATNGMISHISPLLQFEDKTSDFSFTNTFVFGASVLLNFKEEEAPLPRVVNENQDSTDIIREETVHTNGVEIKNETAYTPDPHTILSETLNINKNAKVLIVHTHGSESYTPSKKYSYEHSGNYRTRDSNYNMIRVGEELKKALEAKGIKVIHDKTINDYPSYSDSYNKTEKLIRSHLEKDKSIEFVFDIHRDAVGTPDNTIKFTADIGGKNVAQVMTVCGTDTNLENPVWEENLRLAVHMQNYFNVNYPGFLRPINLRKERFNMHLTTGSLLFEVGTNGNTLDEALRAAKILGDGIGEFIIQNS